VTIPFAESFPVSSVPTRLSLWPALPTALARALTLAASAAFALATALPPLSAFAQSPWVPVGADGRPQITTSEDLPRISRPTSELPGPFDGAAMDRLLALVAGRSIPLRVTQQLDPRMRPSELQWPAVASVVYLSPEAPSVMVTAYSATVGASRIEALFAGEWIDVSVGRTSGFYDLTELLIPFDALVEGLMPATDGDISGALFHAWTEPEGGSGVTPVALESAPGLPRDMRAAISTSALLGTPIVDSEGRLIGICSVATTNRPGGTQVIPSPQIALWWQQPNPDSGPLGWQPNVVEESLTPRVGDEVFAP
jgi:hypothetical protein